MFKLENKPITLEQIKSKVDFMIAGWQKKMPEVEIILGGSLVSGLFILDNETKVIDVDVRFLVNHQPITEELRKRIEEVTGLKYRKSIPVGDWPSGQSTGEMIEGIIKLPDLEFPLDIEGCLRNEKYVGWARFYQNVLNKNELEEFFERKKQLRHDKVAYKALKEEVRRKVVGRCIERGLVDLPMQE